LTVRKLTVRSTAGSNVPISDWIEASQGTVGNRIRGGAKYPTRFHKSGSQRWPFQRV